MKKIWYISLVVAVSVFTLLTFVPPFSYAAPPPRPEIVINHVSVLHVIDGDPSEWSGYTPSIVMNTPDYPIQTYVFFALDPVYLYVLVDAVGDTTNGPNCDEALLEFNSFPTTDIEVGIKEGNITTSHNPFPAGGLVEISFGPSFNSAADHRIYELRIPRSYIGAETGETLDFSSPAIKGLCYGASLPFDGGDGSMSIRDNVYPYWLNQSDINTYALVRFEDAKAIPALHGWGLAIFAVILGLGSIFVLRKKHSADS
jgi:hypothetical protein